MTPTNSNNSKPRLAIVIFVTILVLVAIAAVILTVSSPESSDEGDPTAIVLITAAPFIPTLTSTIEEVSTPTPIATKIPFDEGLIGLITPIDIVGSNISDPTDGLNVRTGPSFDDEVMRKIYVGDLEPFYGIDETGNWCMLGSAGVDGWVACEFVKPIPDDCEVVLDEVAAISSMSDEGCELEES